MPYGDTPDESDYRGAYLDYWLNGGFEPVRQDYGLHALDALWIREQVRKENPEPQPEDLS